MKTQPVKQNEVKRTFMAAKKSAVLELFVYDYIGGDFWTGEGITVKQVADAISSAGPIESITVHVNSPGGTATDGVAIQSLLRQAGVPVNVVVEGLAASAAFTVCMAGDTIQVGENALMMLHNAWSMEAGDAAALRKMADILDKVSGTMAAVYAKRSGQTIEQVTALMAAETWLTADEAINLGFADQKLETTPEKSAAARSLAAQFDLAKMFGKVPEALQPQANEDCACQCESCSNSACYNCMNSECVDPNCEHGPQFPYSATSTHAARCRIAELS